MNLRKRGSTVIVQRASTNNSVVGISIWRTDKQTEKSIFSSMFYSRRGLRSRRCISGTNGPQIHESLSYPNSSQGPALAAFNGRLFMAWKGVEGDQRLFLASTSDGKNFGGPLNRPDQNSS